MPSNLVWRAVGPGLQNPPDQRVHIVSSIPITVIASNYDSTGSGDRYIGTS